MPKDPLVTVLRAIIAFLMGALGLALAMLAVGVVAMPFLSGEIGADLAADGVALGSWPAIGLIELLLVGVLVLLGLAEYFLLQLWRVLGSVREGDPFVPDNARRIMRMAWTALAGNVWAVVLSVYGTWLDGFVDDENFNADLDFGFGGGGLILILVLFVLARVFRHGTALRADLEGTV